MSAQHPNNAVVRELLEQMSAGNFDVAPRLLTQDYVLHPEGIHGADGLTEMVQGYRDQIPDLSATIEHQFTAGDHVATRTTLRGRHVTGHDVEFSMLTLSRCVDGRIAEEWEIADVMSLLGQIGQLPEPASA
jgi:predicted ester cyclase